MRRRQEALRRVCSRRRWDSCDGGTFYSILRSGLRPLLVCAAVMLHLYVYSKVSTKVHGVTSVIIIAVEKFVNLAGCWMARLDSQDMLEH